MGSPTQSQDQENKQQPEIRKDVQKKRASQGQEEGQNQSNENIHESPFRKVESMQNELPKANENNRGAPANNGQ